MMQAPRHSVAAGLHIMVYHSRVMSARICSKDAVCFFCLANEYVCVHCLSQLDSSCLSKNATHRNQALLIHHLARIRQITNDNAPERRCAGKAG